MVLINHFWWNTCISRASSDNTYFLYMYLFCNQCVIEYYKSFYSILYTRPLQCVGFFKKNYSQVIIQINWSLISEIKKKKKKDKFQECIVYCYMHEKYIPVCWEELKSISNIQIYGSWKHICKCREIF